MDVQLHELVAVHQYHKAAFGDSDVFFVVAHKKGS